jgi:four helix bundle protein
MAFFVFLFKFSELKQSYKELDVYKQSFDLFIQIHKITLQLPKHELYELGSQIRRSSDSIVTNIVEGYGRRMYKNEFVRFLVFSHASCLETICHLDKIVKLYPSMNPILQPIHDQYDLLGKKLFKFISYVTQNWKV